jgi:hypothetical protein
MPMGTVNPPGRAAMPPAPRERPPEEQDHRGEPFFEDGEVPRNLGFGRDTVSLNTAAVDAFDRQARQARNAVVNGIDRGIVGPPGELTTRITDQLENERLAGAPDENAGPAAPARELRQQGAEGPAPTEEGNTPRAEEPSRDDERRPPARQVVRGTDRVPNRAAVAAFAGGGPPPGSNINVVA